MNTSSRCAFQLVVGSDTALCVCVCKGSNIHCAPTMWQASARPCICTISFNEFNLHGCFCDIPEWLFTHS